MTQVHVLTPGFVSPNGRAFLFPLVRHRRALRARGIRLRIFGPEAETARVADCDALLLDSKLYGARWLRDSDGILEEIAALAGRVAKLFYVDTTDSSGWDHCRALPLVTGYLKNQLLRDRRRYLEPLYGHRPYTDHYHRQARLHDKDEARSEPIADPALLDKLAVGWSSGLADYSLLGPLRMAAYKRLPLDALLRFPLWHVPADAPRDLDVSCRIGTDYARATVAWQRKEVARVLAGRLGTGKLSRRGYLAELARSKVVVSPFGLGEITLRDFEIFLAGALALKPDMSHLETWPDLFRDGETMVAFRWDLTDLNERIEALLADEAGRLAIAAEAQARYRRHLVWPEAADLFCDHLEAILRRGEPPAEER